MRPVTREACRQRGGGGGYGGGGVGPGSALADDFGLSDPRIGAFTRLVHAIDAADHRGGLAATRELRRLGFAVALAEPGRPGGGQHGA